MHNLVVDTSQVEATGVTHRGGGQGGVKLAGAHMSQTIHHHLVFPLDFNQPCLAVTEVLALRLLSLQLADGQYDVTACMTRHTAGNSAMTAFQLKMKQVHADQSSSCLYYKIDRGSISFCGLDCMK